LGSRLQVLLSGDDVAGRFTRALLARSLQYAAHVAPEIADQAVDIDRAMRWGYGWELGPFEAWDSLGVARVAELLRNEGETTPEIVKGVLARTGSFYSTEGGEAIASLGFGDLAFHEWARPGVEDASTGRPRRPTTLLEEDSGSVIELGDSIVGLVFRRHTASFDAQVLSMTRRAIDLAAQHGHGLVIAAGGKDFCAGSDLGEFLAWADDGAWDEADQAIQSLQATVRAIRYSPIPVVVAPRGRTVGAGAAFCLAASRSQPLTETSIGLAEATMGLIPIGGSMIEVVRRVVGNIDSASDTFPPYREALENFARGGVSTDAENGRGWAMFRECDLTTADPDRQLGDAMLVARTLAETGYRPPTEVSHRVLGRRGIAAIETLSFNQLVGRRLTSHDRVVLLEMARVTSGGDVAEGTELGEEYLLGLERESFLRLLGYEATRDRIRHALGTGKGQLN
jgi:3-hydroxyacyl-CoA dehydrogenase